MEANINTTKMIAIAAGTRYALRFKSRPVDKIGNNCVRVTLSGWLELGDLETFGTGYSKINSGPFMPKVMRSPACSRRHPSRRWPFTYVPLALFKSHTCQVGTPPALVVPKGRMVACFRETPPYWFESKTISQLGSLPRVTSWVSDSGYRGCA